MLLAFRVLYLSYFLYLLSCPVSHHTYLNYCYRFLIGFFVLHVSSFKFVVKVIFLNQWLDQAQNLSVICCCPENKIFIQG